MKASYAVIFALLCILKYEVFYEYPKGLITFYDLTKKKKGRIKIMEAESIWREKVGAENVCVCVYVTVCIRVCVPVCVYVHVLFTNNSALRPRCPPLVGKTAGAFAGAMHSGMHCVAGQLCKFITSFITINEGKRFSVLAEEKAHSSTGWSN